MICSCKTDEDGEVIKELCLMHKEWVDTKLSISQHEIENLRYWIERNYQYVPEEKP